MVSIIHSAPAFKAIITELGILKKKIHAFPGISVLNLLYVLCHIRNMSGIIICGEIDPCFEVYVVAIKNAMDYSCSTAVPQLWCTNDRGSISGPEKNLSGLELYVVGISYTIQRTGDIGVHVIQRYIVHPKQILQDLIDLCIFTYIYVFPIEYWGLWIINIHPSPIPIHYVVWYVGIKCHVFPCCN